METEPQIIENYVRSGQVRLVYRHLTQIGQGSQLTAEASECAADQNRFWEMRQAIYEQQNLFYGSQARANLEQLAGNLGLDLPSFNACLDSNKYRAMVEADFRAATSDGVRSRPVFDIGTQRLVGALPYEQFATILDQALAANQ